MPISVLLWRLNDINIRKTLWHTTLKIVTAQKVTGVTIICERSDALLGYIIRRAAAGNPSLLVGLYWEYVFSLRTTTRQTMDSQRIRTRLEKSLKSMHYEKNGWKKIWAFRLNKNEGPLTSRPMAVSRCFLCGSRGESWNSRMHSP